MEIRCIKFSSSIDTILYHKFMYLYCLINYRSISTRELMFKLKFRCLSIKPTLLSSHLVQIPEWLRGIIFPVPLSHQSLKLLSTDVPAAMVIGAFLSTVSLKLSGIKKKSSLLGIWDTKKSFIISDFHLNKLVMKLLA